MLVPCSLLSIGRTLFLMMFVIEKERRGDYLGKIVQVILLVLVWIMFCMNDFIGVDIWSKLVVVGEEL
ncbi:hypothetical protein LINPERHAP2_LOCUS26366 [Linum perenne]